MSLSKTTLNLRDDLKEELKKISEKNGATLTAMVNIAIEQYIDSEILRRQMIAEYVAKNNLINEVK